MVLQQLSKKDETYISHMKMSKKVSSLINSVEKITIYYYIYGRNAWHSTWIQRYTPMCMHTTFESAKNQAENDRKNGSVFTIRQLPALLIKSDAFDFIVTQINESNPLAEYQLVPENVLSLNPIGNQRLQKKSCIFSFIDSLGCNSKNWLHKQAKENSLIILKGFSSVQFEELVENTRLMEWKSKSYGKGFYLGWNEAESSIRPDKICSLFREVNKLKISEIISDLENSNLIQKDKLRLEKFGIVYLNAKLMKAPITWINFCAYHYALELIKTTDPKNLNLAQDMFSKLIHSVDFGVRPHIYHYALKARLNALQPDDHNNFIKNLLQNLKCIDNTFQSPREKLSWSFFMEYLSIREGLVNEDISMKQTKKELYDLWSEGCYCYIYSNQPDYDLRMNSLPIGLAKLHLEEFENKNPKTIIFYNTEENVMVRSVSSTIRIENLKVMSLLNSMFTDVKAIHPERYEIQSLFDVCLSINVEPEKVFDVSDGFIKLVDFKTTPIFFITNK